MSRFEFRLPDVGEGVAQAEITSWHVAVGDAVEEDQSIVDVMTDKVTMDVSSPVSGRVVSLHGDVGEAMRVGSLLIVFETDASPPVSPTEAPRRDVGTVPAPIGSAVAPPAPPSRHRPPPPRTDPSVPGAQGRLPLAAPSVRRRAYEMGVALQFVVGSGPGGRILDVDLDAHPAEGGRLAPAQGAATRRLAVKSVKIVGMRRAIAERMAEAKRRIPHFSYVEECDLTELEGLRAEINASPVAGQPKLTLLPFLMRALALALPDFPNVNARFDDEAGVLDVHEGVHVGIATQTDAGLVVPVVRHVEALDVWECARELSRVTKAARGGTASREELGGSTITLTSLGTLGGIAATPVINRPEVAIVGPNKLVPRPMVVGGGVAVRTMMNLSSSFDHRIVDGHEAARFVQSLKRSLERPALLFLDRP